MLHIVLLLIGIVLTGISLIFFTTPFIWIFFGWSIVFLSMSILGKKSVTRLLFLYISFILFTWGIYETYLWIYDNPARVHEERHGKKFFRADDVLGYAAVENSMSTHIRYYKDKKIFEAVYTIDSTGLRISPPYNGGEKGESILFFGDSFTFGIGVNDNETLPYVTGIKTGGKYCIYNFGFGGYGAHQMLASIEKGMVESIVKYKPKYAIYQGLFDDIYRSSGRVPWDKHGPRYLLLKNGNIAFTGHFDDPIDYKKYDRSKSVPPKKLIIDRILPVLKKSLAVKKIFYKYTLNHYLVDLFVELINKSRKLIESRYPGCEFHMILWDEDNFRNKMEVIEKVRKKGIRLHLIGEIFQGKVWSQFLYRHDGHPNALTHQVISDYIIQKIIRESNTKK
jgi:hypothetical protein